MTTADLDQVLALTGLVPEAPQWSAAQYGQALAEDSSALLLRFSLGAYREGILAGAAFASLVKGESSAELETILVSPHLRRRGTGTALLYATRESVLQAGAGSLRLEVRPSNQTACNFYLRHGFREYARRRQYYCAPVEDALLLQLLF
jgi:ribosomal protein S18 acetylase RimI-like enzyme